MNISFSDYFSLFLLAILFVVAFYVGWQGGLARLRMYENTKEASFYSKAGIFSWYFPLIVGYGVSKFIDNYLFSFGIGIVIGLIFYFVYFIYRFPEGEESYIRKRIVIGAFLCGMAAFFSDIYIQ